MTTRVLVVEDEPLVRDLVVLNLEDAGYRVDAASTFAEAQARLQVGPWSLVVLDRMLPGGDGLELLADLRRRGDRVPVLVLTARGELPSKVRAFEAGADDYLPKPFALHELLLRCRALLRRSGAPELRAASGASASVGDCLVRLDTGEAWTRHGRRILDGDELTLLALLVRMEHRLVTTADLAEELGAEDAAHGVPAVIDGLRRHFEPDPDRPVHFVSQRGGGIVFRRAPEEA